MATLASATKTGEILVTVFDGARQPFPAADHAILFHLRDPFGSLSVRHRRKQSSLRFAGVPVRSGARADYAVLASASRHRQAGSFPVRVQATKSTDVDIMLLPSKAVVNFHDATWRKLPTTDKAWRDVLVQTAGNVSDASLAYGDLMENHSAALACALNVWEIFRHITIPDGNPRNYLHSLLSFDKKDVKPDRLFAWCRRDFIQQVRQAANNGIFQQVPAAGFMHPGATLGFKEHQHKQANLQICFHEHELHPKLGDDVVKTEFDVDYFRDPLAHFFLEVAVNKLTGSLTNPQQVYCLRWMASRSQGGQPFDPLFTIQPA